MITRNYYFILSKRNNKTQTSNGNYFYVLFRQLLYVLNFFFFSISLYALEKVWPLLSKIHLLNYTNYVWSLVVSLCTAPCSANDRKIIHHLKVELLSPQCWALLLANRLFFHALRVKSMRLSLARYYMFFHFIYDLKQWMPRDSLIVKL